MDSIQEFDLPKTLITRILKTALPPGTLIQKEARLAFLKAATVFIHYITATANDLVLQSNHKTLTPQVIYKALELVDMESLVPGVSERVSGNLRARAHTQTAHKALSKQKRLDKKSLARQDSLESLADPVDPADPAGALKREGEALEAALPDKKARRDSDPLQIAALVHPRNDGEDASDFMSG